MAKPRTNDQTIQYWADSILAREPAPSIRVNSIMVEYDTVYSFGYHYPMGVIERHPNGKTKRVVLNSDYYPVRGFANTPGDQWQVGACAREICHSHGIEIIEQLLSFYKTDGKVQVRPYPDDPEPPERTDYEVQVFFWSSDPGPEPVDPHPEDCIAGQRYGVTKFNDHVLKWTHELREKYDEDGPDVFLSEMHRYHKVDYAPVGRANHVLAWIDAVESGRELVWVKTWQTKWTEYGTKSYDRVEGAEYERCPHCAEFAKVHDAWHARMYGARYGRGRNRGWSQFCENVETYMLPEDWDRYDDDADPREFVQGWREARKLDAKRVTQARRDRKEWVERNWIPSSAVPHVGFRGRPDLDPDGFAKRKHEHEYRKAQRERAAEDKRRAAEAERLNFVLSNEPRVYKPTGRPVAVILPRTDPRFTPSLVLVPNRIGAKHEWEREEVLLRASEQGRRINIVPASVFREYVNYVNS